jgi:dCTP deaminase
LILSDYDLKNALLNKDLNIINMRDDTITVNGADLRLNNSYYVERGGILTRIWNLISGAEDAFSQNNDERFKFISNADYIVIPALSFAIVSTKELVVLPNNIAGTCSIRSSIARNAILAPPTIVDAGYHGSLTITLFNASTRRLRIKVEEKFLHLVLEYLNTPATNPYNGVYQGSKSTVLPIHH